jgi:hypothetical protein
MMRFLVLLLAAVSAAAAADIRYTWLPFSNNVPGLSQTQSDGMQYGISVFLQSDNPAVTEFQVAVVVRSSKGDVRVINGTALRQGKADGVQYSTLCALWVDTQPNFDVLAIEVKAVSSTSSSKPIAGTAYTSSGTVD